MSFKNISNIQLEYRTLADQVVTEFYIPCLKEAVSYKRAVGFFSSSILLQISKGLASIAQRGGKIKLLVSPRLEKADYEAIKEGYEIRSYINNKLEKDFDESIEIEQKEERLTLLSYLISKGILDIRVAVVEDEKHENAMYHEKLGIMADENDNVICFSGSANETNQGYNINYECIDVYCSWKSEDATQRCAIKDVRFDKMWDGDETSLLTIPFPQVIKDKILEHNKYDTVNFVDVDNQFLKEYVKNKINRGEPTLKNVKLYDYQLEAIENWKNRKYRAVFDMATGTGKTFTALGAMTKLFKDKGRIFVVICCPFIHLVEQWGDEVKAFGIEAIKCYGATDYKDRFKRQVTKFKLNRTNFVCVITTNSTFQSDFFQEMIDENLSETLIICDEAHNFGATRISEYLNKNYPYRIALSATLDRYGDEKGTQKLYDFFGEKCIQYGLDRAIKEQKLTPYKYYPVVTILTEDEYEEYRMLSEKIRKFHYEKGDEIPEGLKQLLIKRARIVAGADNKIACLKNVIKKYKKDANILVYCGAVKYGDYGYDNDDIQGKKQISRVLDLLNNDVDLDMVATKFTSEEDSEERKRILSSFKNEDIQALVAIKCLDEGVNVPAIKTAFILASSTNPKEYIQRRGRVLRKYSGKEYAEIYDFITLPRKLEEVSFTNSSLMSTDLSLVKKELLRLIDFANLSNNPAESNTLIDEIKNVYCIDTIQEEDTNIYE